MHIYRYGAHGLSLSDETTAGTGAVPDGVSEWFMHAVQFMKRLK